MGRGSETEKAKKKKPDVDVAARICAFRPAEMGDARVQQRGAQNARRAQSERKTEKSWGKDHTHIWHICRLIITVIPNFGAFVIRFLPCCYFIVSFCFYAYVSHHHQIGRGTQRRVCVCARCVSSTIMYRIMVHIVCGVGNCTALCCCAVKL